MKIVLSRDKGFSRFLDTIIGRGARGPSGVEATVRSILDDVRDRGDAAVRDYTRRFDAVDLKGGGLRVSTRDIDRACRKVSRRDMKLLELASGRIESFHRRQLESSWFVTEPDGTILGMKVTPIQRAGIYVPGGKAAYPSTVLMNAIPARVAGVEEVVMATPPGGGGGGGGSGVSPYVLAAARIAGVDRVYRIGGAQAIGAMAYGTRSVPKVDKITGPGNIYVATAKRLVYGVVDIDMVAGPSEILIINDGTGTPGWIAADLLSQAEHDELASSVLITTSRVMAEAVVKEVGRQLKRLKRRAVASKSISNYGAVIVAKDLGEAVKISDRIAPEHLELFVERPFELMAIVRNAGAIFLGSDTPEAVGDYVAGPNHTLPTGGTARFFSPLGVGDFIKRSSVIGLSRAGLDTLGPAAERFAALEGFDAHLRSVKARRSPRRTIN
jgi:histidinol dehydrogenase